MKEKAFFYDFGKVVKDIMKAPRALLITNDIMKSHASPTWRKGLDHGELYAEGIVIEAWIEEDHLSVEVGTDITARKKGDQALKLLKKHLLQIKKISGKTVIHKGVPTNEAATALFMRHSEYIQNSDNEWILEIS